MNMKTLSAIFIALFIFGCNSDPTTTLPVYWEYSPGKWISSNEDFELEWDHNKKNIEQFEITRMRLKLEETDIREIKKLIKKQNIDGLIRIENQFRKRISFNQKAVVLKPSKEMSFKDTKKPTPTFDEFCFYQVRALKGNDSSNPAELSVILLSKK